MRAFGVSTRIIDQIKRGAKDSRLKKEILFEPEVALLAINSNHVHRLKGNGYILPNRQIESSLHLSLCDQS